MHLTPSCWLSWHGRHGRAGVFATMLLDMASSSCERARASHLHGPSAEFRLTAKGCSSRRIILVVSDAFGSELVAAPPVRRRLGVGLRPDGTRVGGVMSVRLDGSGGRACGHRVLERLTSRASLYTLPPHGGAIARIMAAVLRKPGRSRAETMLPLAAAAAFSRDGRWFAARAADGVRRGATRDRQPDAFPPRRTRAALALYSDRHRPTARERCAVTDATTLAPAGSQADNAPPPPLRKGDARTDGKPVLYSIALAPCVRVPASTKFGWRARAAAPTTLPRVYLLPSRRCASTAAPPDGPGDCPDRPKASDLSRHPNRAVELCVPRRATRTAPDPWGSARTWRHHSTTREVLNRARRHE